MPQNLRDTLAEKMPNTMSGTGFGMTESGGAGVGAGEVAAAAIGSRDG